MEMEAYQIAYLHVGDIISITEKIDGANSSFCVDDNELGISCYSRRQKLDPSNRLRGFYDFILDVIVPMKDKLNPNYRYYGEWCCSHTVQYKPEAYKKFYLFSIWDEEADRYLSDEIVKSEADRLGLTLIPYLYQGEYISYEHLMSFVGKSDLTLEPNTGEGVVVKNVSYLDRFNRQIFVKLVSEKFSEVVKQKPPKDPTVNNEFRDLIRSVLTEARVEKLINKLVDEGVLKEDYAIEDMGIILKNLGNRVFEDIMKEESDLLKNYEEQNIKRAIGKNLPNTVKIILNSKNRV